ncbi:hypothetical protein G5T42_16895 [Microbacterium sp. 4R-513]|uniref:DUF7144 family membrane protein n=1 Tax=Microbacterium sp. 4R-513 TaxID=2567934 RepID=UPI0013E1A4B8|nr:hypothetical protein [Microbacterium sp. 4R-513]QIG40942.1 hypothetical protein G5T42_16895 [Microbacterium sp. 4R-513]
MSNTQQQSGWVGWAVFGGIVLIITGVFDFLFGLAAVVGPDSAYFRNGEGDLWLLNVSGWGWWHLIFGLVLVLVGVFLIRGATWARTIAVIVVGLNAISQLTLLPYQPLWALLIIGLDLLVIYAVVVHGRELRTRD